MITADRFHLRALRNHLTQQLALHVSSMACRMAGPDVRIGRPVTAMGLQFCSPVGLAAGFDRDNRLGRRVSVLGFGFNEVGSLGAEGVAALKSANDGTARLGINLTLDSRQSPAQACKVLRDAWPHADYLMLNLMGPASRPLLQEHALLRQMLVALRHEQHQLNRAGARSVPLAVKLRCLPGQAPLMQADMLLELGYDGLLAAHDPGPPATRQRYRDWQQEHRQRQACDQIEQLQGLCGTELTLMSVGGIQTAAHLRMRMDAGARLVQVHAALGRQGPWLAARLLQPVPI